jgi:Outer spore coat protein E (CotE).
LNKRISIVLKEGESFVESINQATREIIAQTTCGWGFKDIEYIKYIELKKDTNLTRILGCSITNAGKPKALKWKVPERSRYYVPVKGSFDIHVWYSYNNDLETAVASTTVVYHETIPISERSGRPIGPVVATATLETDPVVASTELEGNTIRVVVLLSISAEVVGESRLMVEIAEPIISAEVAGESGHLVEIVDPTISTEVVEESRHLVEIVEPDSVPKSWYPSNYK